MIEKIDYGNRITNDGKLNILKSKYFEVVDCIVAYGYTQELQVDLSVVLQAFYDFYIDLDNSDDSGLGQAIERTKVLKSITNCFYQALAEIQTEQKVGLNPYASLCSWLGKAVCTELMQCNWFMESYGILNEDTLEKTYFSDKIGFFEKQKKQKELKPLLLTVEAFTKFVELSRDYAYRSSYILTKSESDKDYIELAILSLEPIRLRIDKGRMFRYTLLTKIDELSNYTKTV